MTDVKNKLVIYTDGGYREVDGEMVAGAGIWIEGDTGGLYVPCGMDQEGVKTSNNVGELIGIRKALDLIHERDIKEATIKSDSQYGLNAISLWSKKWEKNNWHKADGTIIANYTIVTEAVYLWREIIKTKKVNFEWVKGHSDLVGNDNADALATHGLYMARQLGVMEIEGATYIELNDCVALGKGGVVIERKEALTHDVKAVVTKTKALPINNFLAFQKILCLSNLTNLAEDGRTAYTITTYPTKTKGDMDLDVDARMSKVKTDYSKTCLCGVIDPDTVEGVVFTKEPCVILEKIMAKQDKISIPRVNLPYLLDWAAIRSGTKWKGLCDSIDTLKAADKNVHSATNIQLSYFLQVPAISMQCWDRGVYLKWLLQEFEKGKIDNVDITDYFFEKAVKGKRKMKLEVAKLPIYRIEEHNTFYLFTPDRDCPDKNTLVRIMNAYPESKIYLVRSTITKGSLRYHMVIESDNNIGIYGSPAGNIKLY